MGLKVTGLDDYIKRLEAEAARVQLIAKTTNVNELASMVGVNLGSKGRQPLRGRRPMTKGLTEEDRRRAMLATKAMSSTAATDEEQQALQMMYWADMLADGIARDLEKTWTKS